MSSCAESLQPPQNHQKSNDQRPNQLPSATKTTNLNETSIPSSENNPTQPLRNYKLEKQLGKGNFAIVHLAQHRLTGMKVAIKAIDKDLIFNRKDYERISRELSIMKCLNNPYLIVLYEIIETPKHLYLVLEYAPDGDLFDKVSTDGALPEAQAARMFTQILLGLKNLHDSCIAHRDIKPENLLLFPQQRVKLADFGLGCKYGSGKLLKTACGSPGYAPPQMLNKVDYEGQKADIWSSGIVFFVMLAGYLPWEDANVSRLFDKIRTRPVKVPKSVSAEYRDLLVKILSKDPAERPTISDLLKHPLIVPHVESLSLQDAQYDSPIDQDTAKAICASYHLTDETMFDELCLALEKGKKNQMTACFELARKKFVSGTGKNKQQELGAIKNQIIPIIGLIDEMGQINGSLAIQSVLIVPKLNQIAEIQQAQANKQDSFQSKNVSNEKMPTINLKDCQSKNQNYGGQITLFNKLAQNSKEDNNRNYCQQQYDTLSQLPLYRSDKYVAPSINNYARSDNSILSISVDKTSTIYPQPPIHYDSTSITPQNYQYNDQEQSQGYNSSQLIVTNESNQLLEPQTATFVKPINLVGEQQSNGSHNNGGGSVTSLGESQLESESNGKSSNRNSNKNQESQSQISNMGMGNANNNNLSNHNDSKQPSKLSLIVNDQRQSQQSIPRSPPTPIIITHQQQELINSAGKINIINDQKEIQGKNNKQIKTGQKYNKQIGQNDKYKINSQRNNSNNSNMKIKIKDNQKIGININNNNNTAKLTNSNYYNSHRNSINSAKVGNNCTNNSITNNNSNINIPSGNPSALPIIPTNPKLKRTAALAHISSKMNSTLQDNSAQNSNKKIQTIKSDSESTEISKSLVRKMNRDVSVGKGYGLRGIRNIAKNNNTNPNSQNDSMVANGSNSSHTAPNSHSNKSLSKDKIKYQSNRLNSSSKDISKINIVQKDSQKSTQKQLLENNISRKNSINLNSSRNKYNSSNGLESERKINSNIMNSNHRQQLKTNNTINQPQSPLSTVLPTPQSYPTSSSPAILPSLPPSISELPNDTLQLTVTTSLIPRQPNLLSISRLVYCSRRHLCELLSSMGWKGNLQVYRYAHDILYVGSIHLERVGHTGNSYSNSSHSLTYNIQQISHETPQKALEKIISQCNKRN